jgi:hypothetical protein
MLPLTDFLKKLPGIMPRKARELVLKGGILSKEQRSDIYYRDDSLFDFTYLIGPSAAAAVLEAYKAGRLPIARGQSTGEAPDAEQYVGSEIAAKEAAERARRMTALDDPRLIVEKDLRDHHFIDSIFLKHVGRGSNSMTLAGINVRKTVEGYKSNSGQSTWWRVKFEWTGSDGKVYNSDAAPRGVDRRRKDQDRNWGLHD